MTERRDDSMERAAAIDPTRSAIIQAPAGSGKTELLIQRYLGLLATVEDPRQVLAITFTRKATQEMVERVRRVLLLAAAGQSPDAEHQRLAFTLAGAVLERDRERQWNLLDDPAQLQIHTFDGLCARIAALGAEDARGLAAPQVLEHPQRLYAEAASRAIEAVAEAPPGEPARQALEQLLLRLRGSAGLLRGLLVDELGRRDQWLAAVAAGPMGQQRVLRMRQALELQALDAVLGAERLERALNALALLATASDEGAGLLAALDALQAEPDAVQLRVRALHTALSVLAIQSGAPMAGRSMNSRVLPGEHAQRRAWLSELGEINEAWRGDPQAVALFQRFVSAPPLDDERGERELLAWMRGLLLQACAELRVQFAERGACDFQHVAELALAALGGDLDPGQALLVEDGRLQHVLVDEFQDTSLTQYRLLERLTAGWEPGDGRTLFLVGDPMQSIYRFRKADVGLYLQVFAEARLGEVPLQPLRLRCNFRSAEEVVNFVNAWLPAVFSPPHPATTGAVGYEPVAARQPEGGRVALHPAPLADPLDEAARIAGLIAELSRQHPDWRIGVLGRTRGQLEAVAQALTEWGVAFEAVDTRQLKGRQVVQDLFSLLRALLHPADRVAWLALLHAPWCGLDAAGLHAVAGEEFTEDVLARMGDAGVLGGLSADEARRVAELRQVMGEAVATAGTSSLRRRVEAAWLRLGGPCMLASAADLEDARSWLELLSRLEAEQPEDLLEELQYRVEQLYAGSNSARVQLMTIHKAKGLEFDAVLLPGLEKRVGGFGLELFRQQEFSGLGGGVLAAPMTASGAKAPSLYRYLGKLAQEEEQCEAQRVLYVALTRAKRELHLFGAWKVGGSGATRGPTAPGGSLLALLWEPFALEIARLGQKELVAEAGPVETPPLLPLLRLVGAPAPALQPEGGAPGVEFSLAVPEPDALALGSACHLWLELIHDHWDEAWLGDWYQGKRAALEASLRHAGAGETALPGLYERLCNLLRQAIANAQVREWLSGAADGSVSEAVFYRAEGGRLQRQVIDLLRPNGQGGWEIVDWKTSAALATDEWGEQLRRYAECVREAGLGEVAALTVFQPDAGRTTVVPFDP